MVVGSGQTRLIILRGNSGAGKSTVAMALRDAYGRGLAWVSQDLIRRIMLKERDRPGAVNIGLIDQIARYCLDHCRQVASSAPAFRPAVRAAKPCLAGLNW